MHNLFGSFARNEFRKDSDIDIAVYAKDYKKLLLNFEQKLGLKIEKRGWQGSRYNSDK